MKNLLNCFLLLGGIIFIQSCSNSNGNSKIQGYEENLIQVEKNDTSGVINGVFDIPELMVAASPASPQSITINTRERIVDYDVSPAGPIVAAIVKDTSKNFNVKLWKVGQNRMLDSCRIPNGYIISAITWHPRGTALFVLGSKDKKYNILRLEKSGSAWTSKVIFSSNSELRRLVACPRPFIVSYSDKKDYFKYRLFFGMGTEENSYRIASITESGTRFYQVVGPKKSITHFQDDDIDASTMEADWALPIAFHPAGHQLIWENKQHNFFVAAYDGKYWDKSKPMGKGAVKEGTITPTPNGLGLIHWQKNKPGIGVYLISRNKEEVQASDYKFISTPSSVPDGKGIIGLTNTNGQYSLNYVPINVPLADVVNAWMFAETSTELSLLQKNYGLFRTDEHQQLYELYDSENYACNGYDRTHPTRPYLVTTDIFWELFGAAYQGLFIVKERDQAIPNFWKFITASNDFYKKNPNSSWASAITALTDLKAGNNKNLEIQKMIAQVPAKSEILKDNYNFSELKPRGHYTSTPEMQKYFMAFKYFTTVYKDNQKVMQELNTLPPDIKAYAVKWIESYMGFISPSRNPLVWSDFKNTPPAYNKHPGEGSILFPLSWGFDNEVLYSTVYHEDLPKSQQITGSGGERLVPSGIDLAAALGNTFSETLLESDYQKYPPLRKVIENLKKNFSANRKSIKSNDNLYDKWLTALAIQWADTVMSPNGDNDKSIWKTKRLQTGLASWATLRHATGLVNERTAAECGEGGFEEILLRAPRGYIEPDPYTFGAVADLFEAAIKYVPESIKEKAETLDDEKGSLYEGIVKRLKEAATDARIFQSIAIKEKRGEEITNAEYEKILYLGRVAEHYFLIFKSLSNKDYALSTPDPMAKIMDVAGGGVSPFLMAAVGNSLEWNHIVPYFGRKEIVKGSVYSYYEFQSNQLLNDKDWQQKLKSQERISCVKPFVTEQGVSHPASTGY